MVPALTHFSLRLAILPCLLHDAASREELSEQNLFHETDNFSLHHIYPFISFFTSDFISRLHSYPPTPGNCITRPGRWWCISTPNLERPRSTQSVLCYQTRVTMPPDRVKRPPSLQDRYGFSYAQPEEGAVHPRSSPVTRQSTSHFGVPSPSSPRHGKPSH